VTSEVLWLNQRDGETSIAVFLFLVVSWANEALISLFSNLCNDASFSRFCASS